MSWGRFHHSGGPSSWMRRCSAQKTPAPRPPVVVIDEDDDMGDGSPDSEVFIIDDAADIARAAAACNSKKGNSSSSNVINLDDDDDDEDEEEDDEAEVDRHRAGPSTAGARSPAAAAATPPVHGSSRNRYGLDYVSDSEKSDFSWSSDSDCSSDCEILEDTSGSVRKQWEKAASRKTVPNDPSKRRDGRSSRSTSSVESSTQDDEKVEDLFGAECHINDNVWEYFSDVYKEAGASTSGAKYSSGPSVPSAPPTDNVSNGKETEDCNTTSSLDPKTAYNDETAHSYKSPLSENNTERRSQAPHLDEFLEPEGDTRYSFVSANRVFPSRSSANWKVGSLPIFVSTPEKMDEKVPDGFSSEKDRNDAHSEITKQNKDTCFAPSSSRNGCLGQSGEYCAQRQADSFACAAASNKNASANDILGNCSLPPKNSVDDPENLGQSAMVQDAPDFQNSLIVAREKHKESDEYKRAAEEEWASRQRQLAIQAEEAQRLRKRKKAEALRLLDMQKRQKQRLEEVRESQRKNEEAIQLKEQYRGVVRSDLENMERRYRDMTSILRALGIPVEGIEVKAAYKQALLKFHPDRVSRNDMYQQVKAEETFKFISRLKEKLLRF